MRFGAQRRLARAGQESVRWAQRWTRREPDLKAPQTQEETKRKGFLSRILGKIGR